MVRIGLLGVMLAALAGSAAANDLEIITPHNEQIQQEFEQAFAAHLGRPVKIRWLKQGTGQLLKVLEAKERSARGGSFGLDVFFGGGVPDHQLAAKRGFLEKPRLPAEVLSGIPADIAGVANYDPDGLWYGSALSAFGVLVNQRGLNSQKLPEVTTWADLADPRMFSWVVIADPRKSSSVRVSYELILQQYGWEKGWPMLMQLAANSRSIVDASSIIPNEVASGSALAGVCIDFYAHARVSQAGAGTLAYINPQGGSAITPDPISMLRQPPNRELAEQFIAFVLSPEGQRLWILAPGTPGGPRQHALYRLPVRSDVFAGVESQTTIRNPYEEAGRGAFRKMDDQLQNQRSKLLAELMGAALVDLHDDLKSTWKALIDGGMKPAALAEWNTPPFSDEEALQIAARLEAGGREERTITRQWTMDFKKKFERIRQMSK